MACSQEDDTTTVPDASAPAFLALRENAAFLQDHGARMLEGIDAYSAARSLRCLGIVPSVISMVIWGSPHVELADGSHSRPKAGPAKIEKVAAFESLRAQFPHSFVLILYAGHDIGRFHGHGGRRSEAILNIPAWLPDVADGISYYPRNSCGTLRGGGAPCVMALLQVPLHWTGHVDWGGCLVPAPCPNKDGEVGDVLDVFRLVALASAVRDSHVIFLGEERASLSRCCAHRYLEQRNLL